MAHVDIVGTCVEFSCCEVIGSMASGDTSLGATCRANELIDLGRHLIPRYPKP